MSSVWESHVIWWVEHRGGCEETGPLLPIVSLTCPGPTSCPTLLVHWEQWQGPSQAPSFNTRTSQAGRVLVRNSEVRAVRIRDKRGECSRTIQMICKCETLQSWKLEIFNSLDGIYEFIHYTLPEPKITWFRFSPCNVLFRKYHSKCHFSVWSLEQNFKQGVWGLAAATLVFYFALICHLNFKLLSVWEVGRPWPVGCLLVFRRTQVAIILSSHFGSRYFLTLIPPFHIST